MFFLKRGFFWGEGGGKQAKYWNLFINHIQIQYVFPLIKIYVLKLDKILSFSYNFSVEMLALNLTLEILSHKKNLKC